MGGNGLNGRGRSKERVELGKRLKVFKNNVLWTIEVGLLPAVGFVLPFLSWNILFLQKFGGESCSVRKSSRRRSDKPGLYLAQEWSRQSKFSWRKQSVRAMFTPCDARAYFAFATDLTGMVKAIIYISLRLGDNFISSIVEWNYYGSSLTWDLLQEVYKKLPGAWQGGGGVSKNRNIYPSKAWRQYKNSKRETPPIFTLVHQNIAWRVNVRIGVKGSVRLTLGS